MSPFLVSLLLVLALVLPLLGAVTLRVLNARLTPQQRIGIAALVTALPILSVIVLSRANVPTLRVAGVTVLLAEEAEDAPLAPAILDGLPVDNAEPEPHDHATAESAASPAAAPTAAQTAAPSEEPAAPTAAPTEAPTEAPTAVPTAPPTETPTAEPTATPEPPTPTSAPPTEPRQAPARRTYVVQQGDTLRGIAEQFDVTVAQLLEANNLTPQQADALRPGQELVIP